MINKMSPLILLCLIFLSNKIEAQELPVYIVNARLVHYSSNTDRAHDQISILSEKLKSLGSSDGSAESASILSEIYLYKGLLERDLNMIEASSATLLEGIKYCDTAFERYNTEYFLSKSALLKSQWMMLQNTRTIIRTGGEIQDMADRALEINPESLTALILSAQGMINAPPLFGGNPDRAVDLLQASLPLAVTDFDRFSLYLSLADAHRRKKRWTEADEWCLRALSLYPRNSAALQLQKDVSEKKKN